MVNVDSDRTAEELNAAYRRRFPDLTDDERRRRLMTAEEHWIPGIRLAEGQAAAGGPAGMYRFDWAPADAAQRGLRASHMMEVPFVFGTYDALPEGGLTGNTPDREPLSQAMGDAWARFVATGDPSWPRFDPAERATMVFDRVAGIRVDPDAEERRLWDGRLV
ncbi:MAG: carboxylesterase family protein [Solirubrobacterales bacterium]